MGPGDPRQQGGWASPANSRMPSVTIPDTGAAKYWYVDPRAYQSPEHEDQGESMAQDEANRRQFEQWNAQPVPSTDHMSRSDQEAFFDALRRIQTYQPQADQGQYGF